jgi:hypothetical protein
MSLLQKDHKFAWTKECEAAFRTLRELLTTAPALAQPDIESHLMCFVMYQKMVYDVF